MARSQRTFCRSEAPRRGAARGARRRSCARARTCCRATNAANHARGRARVDVDTPSCTEKVTADTIESAPAFGGSRARRVAVTTFPRFFGKSPSFGESKKRAGRLVAVQVVLPHEKPTSMVRTFSHHASGKRHASGKDARASIRTRELYSLESSSQRSTKKTHVRLPYLTQGQKCWQSACASSAVTHEGARFGCR
jgi:hypothetical protein